ncbi:hypothetical protein B0T14DRAFT_495530 [Immersiella caudata]|uniref:Uncharacterized protein n=1 Tax=Immersiella caudata TaxID=314043 RepID=A0AA39WYY9_9PEZI|nr:hypothetical protein B0T14DRAFT_495530 [Immersiella caudata]
MFEEEEGASEIENWHKWFTFARNIIEETGTTNASNMTTMKGWKPPLVRGIPSSECYDYSNCHDPIFTGSGPIWGCTCVFVFSVHGVWMAHFWENPQMMNSNGKFKTEAIKFLGCGDPDLDYPGIEQFGLPIFRYTPRHRVDYEDGSHDFVRAVEIMFEGTRIRYFEWPWTLSDLDQQAADTPPHSDA